MSPPNAEPVALTMPPIVSRAQWLAARKQLLLEEKALMRERDALNARRRQLPMVKIDEDYRFEGPQGSVSLLHLFEGHRQLIVYHFMFLRERGEGCPGCSYFADNIPHLAHLHAHDTALALVSRAPLAEIAPFQARMGWSAPWYSSFGSLFNYDFHVSIDASVAPVEYNYCDQAELEQKGQAAAIKGELPGLSVFVRDGAFIFHTYSTYARGLDVFLNTHNLLDQTPFGRGQGWDGMPDLKVPLRHHDRYSALAGG